MIIESKKEKVEIFKEWRCNSRPYRYLILFTSTFFYLALILVLVMLPDPDWFTINLRILIGICLLGVVAFFSGRTFFNQKHGIKQVRFTPEVIYVEGKKINLCYLDSIYFVRKVEMRNRSFVGTTIAIEFRMTFIPNSIINEEVDFYMEFGKSIFSKIDKYDYENRFIKVLQCLAKERKEKFTKTL